MAIISKNFIEDTQGSSIDITPVVVIANLVNDKYELLDCFSNKKVTISDTDNQEIQSNIKLLNSNKKKKRKLAEKNLLELKGRLKSELRAAQNQINKILNNPNYE